MAVLIKAKSGKSLLFVDDFGNTYITSVHYTLGLINNESPRQFILLKKLPANTIQNRFQPSPTLGDAGSVVDPFGYEAQMVKKENKPIEDVNF